MSVEDKLTQLAALAESLKEQEALALEEAKKEEKASETKDEPEGSDGKSEIETDDEEDKLEELSFKTLHSYAKKSQRDIDKRGDEDDDGEFDDKKYAKNMKREQGINTAERKLAESEETKMDLGALFEGEEFTEEFKTTATEIFEATVKLRVEAEVAALTAELQESFEQKTLEESTELKESLVDKVDGYLDYMVEQWMNKNELAINRGIKTEILESFVSGMKDVFESHYIDVPDEKFDLVEAAQSEVAELEARLDEAVARNVELTGTLKEVNRQIMIDEAVEGMVETDSEKFRQLAEELTYSDEGFDRKLATIKESYFSKSAKPSSKQLVEEFMTDEPVAETLEEAVKIDPVMAQYLTAIERSTR
jgi:hypothetical protein